MRWRILVGVSLVVNVVLAFLLWKQGRLLSDQTDLLLRPSYEAPLTNAVETQVVVRRQFFEWSEVESADYPTYIDNLRSIGCPPSTIRDIIVADVNQLYSRRKIVEVIVPDMEWWRMGSGYDAADEVSRQLAQIENERRDLLSQLLGPDWEVVTTPPARFVFLSGPELDALDPETKQAVQEISGRHDQRRARYIAQQEAAGQPVDPAELARLRDQERQQLTRLLTPAQLEAYLLRYSFNAEVMRRQLVQFDATPEEFRAIFRVRDPIDHQIQLHYSEDTEADQRQRAQLEAQRDAAIKQALGPERFRDYQFNLDPEYREAKSFAKQLNIPEKKILTIYEINRATAATLNEINNSANLSPTEREIAIAQTRAEARETLRKVVGDEAWQTYLETRPESETIVP